MPLDWKPEDLDDAILSFEAIQAEINYQQAQDSLRHLVSNLDLAPQERTGLEPEIERLSTAIEKLEQGVVQIAAFGMVGRGKSSVLNALLGQDLFATGPLHGVTRAVDSAEWHLATESLPIGRETIQRVSLAGLGKTQVQLVDTPGIDEVDGATREAMARQVARQADLLLFAIAGDITQVEYTALSQLREAGKPMLLVFNKIDQYPEADRQAIYRKICDERVKQLLSPEEIVMVAAAPLVVVPVQQPDGSTRLERRRGEPQVGELKLKILDILHREGKSLLALNTMLYADEVNEQIVARKLAIRAAAAERMILRGTLTKAVAIALNPVTVLDLFSGAIVDVAIVLALSRLYGIPMTQAGALGLLQKIALSMGGLSASEFLANLGLSSLKGLLGLSAPATAGASLVPYVSVALTQAGVGGVSTYAIGQVAKTYLANGASWGPEGPKAVVARILATLDEESILRRIEAELRAKLGGSGRRPDWPT